MLKGETNPDSIAKLTRIAKAISSNVFSELRQRFALAASKPAPQQEQ